eukprot:7032128-Pyramimonas_sp.AAC.1
MLRIAVYRMVTSGIASHLTASPGSRPVLLELVQSSLCLGTRLRVNELFKHRRLLIRRSGAAELQE